jgi:DNA-binding NtrC family response regulator
MTKQKSILIVDDNPGVISALKLLLKEVFGQIIALPSPVRVPSVLRTENPDVVLLDMNFGPGLNSGQDGLTWLKNIHRTHPDIPVILITAYADINLAVRGLKNGAADFVTKPWDNEELLRTLKSAISKSKEIVPLEQIETEHIQRVVEKCHGNISRAAELLGITRQTLYAKIRK